MMSFAQTGRASLSSEAVFPFQCFPTVVPPLYDPDLAFAIVLPRIIAIVAHVETFPAETAEHPAILLFGGLPLQDDQRPPPSMVPAS